MCVCVSTRYAASVKDGSQYFILLIITDGVISDMAQTKESIVNVRLETVPHHSANLIKTTPSLLPRSTPDPTFRSNLFVGWAKLGWQPG